MSSSTSGSSPNNHAALGVHTSNHVYVLNDEYAWVPARWLETAADGLRATVSVASSYPNEQAIGNPSTTTTKSNHRTTLQTVSLNDYPNQALPLQNVDEEGRLRTVQDMVDLPFLHEVRCIYICIYIFLELGWNTESTRASLTHTHIFLLLFIAFVFVLVCSLRGFVLIRSFDR
jgi:hypothetical protein